MVNYRSVAAAFVALTVVFAGAAGYFATNPTTVTTTSVVTSNQLSTVTSVVTQTTTSTVSSVSTTAPVTIKIAYKLGVGFYMTNASGWTLYLRKTDNQSAGSSSCTGGCITAWPAFYAQQPLTLPVGFGDQGDWKLVPRADGIKQLAYYGWPLYYYAKDTKPGDTLGNGVGNVWFVCCSLSAVTSTTSTTATGTGGGAVQVSIASGSSSNQASPGYTPATVTLVRGVNASITWTNKDSATHTVTSLSVPTGAQPFDSGNLAAGASFTVTFTVPGNYTYHCSIHSWMTGTVIVK
jgi:predicted lipoprotein with Yx(FWY)xxD motif